MSLSETRLLQSYIHLHHVFPEDLHIARPLIQMLQRLERIKEARSLALSMARRMLACGKSAYALGFLAICKQLAHPKAEEIEALINMARIADSGPAEHSNGSEHLFTLIDQLSDSEALDFIGQANLMRCEAGRDIVVQGETSTTFYLILEGEVDVHIDIGDGESVQVKHLAAGEFFGEFACVYQLERSATVTTSTPALLLEFSGEAIDQLMQRFPLAGDYLMRTVQVRMVHAITHSIPAFAELPEDDKLWAAQEATVNEYEAGSTIPVSDAASPCCHILLSGSAAISDENGEIILQSGEMFGPVSPYLMISKDAELKACERSLVCSIPGNIFNTFINVYASFDQHVKQTQASRNQK